MITLQLETWDQFYPAAIPLWIESYNEFVSEKRFVLEPDIPSYRLLSNSGMLLILTARKEGKIIGYILMLVRRHMHFVNQVAYLDTLFVSPGYRKGSLLPRMLREVLAVLKASGVDMVYMGTLERRSTEKLLEKLGFEKSEALYTRWIGD